ncbi:MAG: hypothetical protein KIH64_012915, partial [Mycobacterium sp.]|nr:hypothetical protein [Mycobacterium sp.]
PGADSEELGLGTAAAEGSIRAVPTDRVLTVAAGRTDPDALWRSTRALDPAARRGVDAERSALVESAPSRAVSAEAGAETARLMTAPAPSATARPPTRPINPAAVISALPCQPRSALAA